MFIRNTACAPPTLFYKGRCYDMCPLHTYVFNGTNSVFGSDTDNNEDINDATNSQDGEELQSIDRKRKSLYMTTNAEGYKENITDFVTKDTFTLSCQPCDKSCLQCYGPLNSQCSTCNLGSQLKKMAHTNETYCINFSERSSGNAFSNISTYPFNFNLLLFILVPSIIIIILGFVIATCRKSKYVSTLCHKQQTHNELNAAYTYDRVALFADEDIQDDEIDYLKSVPSEVKIYTDNNENDDVIEN